MRTKGSVTIFLALILSLIISLVSGCLVSVQMACARVQIVNAADVGLYSLFAGYDIQMLEKFNLFYLEAGYGGGVLNLAEAYDTVLEYAEPILAQNYQTLSLESGGITGYRLATDNGGESFRSQAEAYMAETLGSQGVALLLDQVKEESEDIQEQQDIMESSQEGSSYDDYDRAVQQGEEAETEESDAESVSVEPLENPIDTIRQIQEMGILELVLTDTADVSEKTVDLSSLASGRQLQEGMGVYEGETPAHSAAEVVLFQEYILQNVGNYRSPVSDGLLSYPMEYILGKHSGDVDNLKAVANRLLLIREGVNFVFLLNDSVKREQATVFATTIASALMIPMAQSLVEILLLACWAYGESILDVRELFDGGKVPLMKDAETWQLKLGDLASLLSHMDTDRRDAENGMSYEDYLRVLLYLEEEDTRTMRCIDAFELTVRGQDGYENFRMDSCLDALEIILDVRANGRKTFQITRQYSYC